MKPTRYMAMTVSDLMREDPVAMDVTLPLSLIHI